MDQKTNPVTGSLPSLVPPQIRPQRQTPLLRQQSSRVLPDVAPDIPYEDSGASLLVV